MSRRQKQPPALRVPGGMRWDRILTPFWTGGEAARLGPLPAYCLVVLHILTDWDTGEICASATQVAKLTGYSVSSINRALSVLETGGHLERVASACGKKTTYRLLRRLFARAADGITVPVSWPYIPHRESERIEAVKSFLASGDPGCLPPTINVHIHVDQLQVVQAGGIGVQIKQATAEPLSEAAVEMALAWWRHLSTEEWQSALDAAGWPPGPITEQAKLAAWEAAGQPGWDRRPLPLSP